MNKHEAATQIMKKSLQWLYHVLHYNRIIIRQNKKNKAITIRQTQNLLKMLIINFGVLGKK